MPAQRGNDHESLLVKIAIFHLIITLVVVTAGEIIKVLQMIRHL